MTIRFMREEEDYIPIILRINEWWGGRNMADMLQRLFVKHFINTCLVAEEDGEIVGFLVGFLSQKDKNVAYIHFCGVSPDHRRKKIGQQLYDRFFQLVAEMGRSKVCSLTSVVNKLSLAFHTGIGFDVTDSPHKLDGVSYFKDYDGPGGDRYLFEIKNPYFK